MQVLHTLRTLEALLKLAEIGLSITVITLTQTMKEFGFLSDARGTFCDGTLVTSLVVTPLLLLCYLLGAARDLQKTPFEALFNLYMAFSMITTGYLTFSDALDFTDDPSFSRSVKTGIAAAGLAVTNGVLYSLDGYQASHNFLKRGEQNRLHKGRRRVGGGAAV